MAKYCNEILIEETYLALDGVSKDLIREVIDNQSHQAERTIKQGAFETFTFKFLGKLTVNMKRVQKLSELKGKVKR